MPKEKKKWDEINALNAARIKGRYSDEVLREMSSAYQELCDREQFSGNPIRAVLLGRGLPENLSKYKLKLAYEIVHNNEYGGLQRKQTPNALVDDVVVRQSELSGVFPFDVPVKHGGLMYTQWDPRWDRIPYSGKLGLRDVETSS